MTSLSIHVPASSANLGPGYDTLGVALTLANEFLIQPAPEKTTLHINNHPSGSLHSLCLEMIQAAEELFRRHTGKPALPLAITLDDHVPIARGMASSATIRLAILTALNHLWDTQLSSRELVLWASQLEGCSDNAAASYFGGLTASGIIQGALLYYQFVMPDAIDFVAVSPVSQVKTDQARTVFAPTISRADAVHTLNRGILLACALASGAFDDVGALLDDKIHQPDRQANIPALRPLFDVIAAAKEAGALGGYLSGSGSTMMALTFQNKESVAQAMQEAIRRHGMEAEIRFLKVDNQGIRIHEIP